MSVVHSTVDQLQARLGGVPLDRIRLVPPPGTATIADLVQVKASEGRTCELIDGVLVDKAMGYYESWLAAALIYFIERFLDENNLGIVLAPDGTLEIVPQLVRAPDVSFLRWERFPDRQLPDEPVPEIAPDLAVEILSKSNTAAEMDQKTGEYFASGVKQVWLIDPETHTARVYSEPDAFQQIDRDGHLSGGQILPGFQLPLQTLFDRAGRRAKDG